MRQGLIYARVSTEDQAKEGQSIEAQIKLCSSYAVDNDIYVQKECIFKDEGKSGSNTNRPGLKSLLEKATTDTNINCILVMDTDRIARNTYDHLGIKALLKKHKVKLISVSQPMIDDSPEGNFIDTVLASANALQSQITGRKSSKVMFEKIKVGWWAGPAPIGYINVDNPTPIGTMDRRIIVPDKDRSSLITQLFKWYATSTFTLQTITAKMGSIGLLTKVGIPIKTSAVARILSNPIYYGDLPWKGELYPGKHEPLIDKDTWEVVQDVLADHNQHASRTRKYNYLLRGFAFCDICGSRFWAAPHKGNTTIKEYYYCKNCKKGTYVDVSKLEDQAVVWMGKLKMTDKYAKELVDKAKSLLDELRNVTEDDRQALVNRKNAIEQQLSTAESKLLSGTLSDERYRALANRLEADMKKVDKDLISLRKDYSKKFEGLKNLTRTARNIGETYKNANPELKRHYLNLFIEKFNVRDGKIITAVASKNVRDLIKQGKIRVQVTNQWLPALEDYCNAFPGI